MTRTMNRCAVDRINANFSPDGTRHIFRKGMRFHTMAFFEASGVLMGSDVLGPRPTALKRPMASNAIRPDFSLI